MFKSQVIIKAEQWPRMNKMSYGYHHIYAFVKKINEKNTEDLQFAETESVLTQS